MILEIKNRPVIWDTPIEAYKNKTVKSDAWVEVCEALNLNYNEECEIKKKQIVA